MGYFLFFFFPLSPIYFVVSLVWPRPLCAPSAIPRMDMESHDRQPHKETWPWPCPCCCHQLIPPPANSSFLLLFFSPGSVCLFLREKKKKEKTWNSSCPARCWSPINPGSEDSQRGFAAFHEVWISSIGMANSRIFHGQFQNFPSTLSLPHSTFSQVALGISLPLSQRCFYFRVFVSKYLCRVLFETLECLCLQTMQVTLSVLKPPQPSFQLGVRTAAPVPNSASSSPKLGSWNYPQDEVQTSRWGTNAFWNDSFQNQEIKASFKTNFLQIPRSKSRICILPFYLLA